MHSITREDILLAKEILEKKRVTDPSIYVPFAFYAELEKEIKLQEKIQKTPLWKILNG